MSEVVAAEAMVRLGGPVDAFRTAAIVISPDDVPIAFRMVPDGDRGVVRVVKEQS